MSADRAAAVDVVLRLDAEASHVPCCTAHGVPMTCERYRRTHFVEVRPCCATDAAELAAAPIPCPSCGGPMGDGDRVTRGVCSMCTRRTRRAGAR